MPRRPDDFGAEPRRFNRLRKEFRSDEDRAMDEAIGGGRTVGDLFALTGDEAQSIDMAISPYEERVPRAMDKPVSPSMRENIRGEYEGKVDGQDLSDLVRLKREEAAGTAIADESGGPGKGVGETAITKASDKAATPTKKEDDGKKMDRGAVAQGLSQLAKAFTGTAGAGNLARPIGNIDIPQVQSNPDRMRGIREFLKMG